MVHKCPSVAKRKFYSSKYRIDLTRTLLMLEDFYIIRIWTMLNKAEAEAAFNYSSMVSNSIINNSPGNLNNNYGT